MGILGVSLGVNGAKKRAHVISLLLHISHTNRIKNETAEITAPTQRPYEQEWKQVSWNIL